MILYNLKITREGVCWVANLSPDPVLDPVKGCERALIGIHLARYMGTEGCIGLMSNYSEELMNAYELMHNTLKYGKTIPLSVQINGR